MLSALAAYRSRQRSSAMRNGIFRASLGRVTCVSVAPENRARYLKRLWIDTIPKNSWFRKRVHKLAFHLPASIVTTDAKDERRRFRAEKDVAELWCVESHNKPPKRLEPFTLTTRERARSSGLRSHFSPAHDGARQRLQSLIPWRLKRRSRIPDRETILRLRPGSSDGRHTPKR